MFPKSAYLKFAINFVSLRNQAAQVNTINDVCKKCRTRKRKVLVVYLELKCILPYRFLQVVAIILVEVQGVEQLVNLGNNMKE